MRNVFLVPYFGKFPNYFQLVLDSCGENNDLYDWIIFTDDKTKYYYPSNVKVFYMTFDELKHLICSKFNFAVQIDTPYKLCDFKPAYGYIFSDYLTEYDYWGHCDVDCIFGKISNFLNENIVSYDRVMRLGHLVLYKNNLENNQRFMLPIDGKLRYKEVYTCKDNCIFDEHNSSHQICIDDIWEYYNFSQYRCDNAIANVWYKGDIFVLQYQNEGCNYSREKKRKAIFYWNQGILFRMSESNGEINLQEFMYIHLMKRKMKNCAQNHNGKIKIIPNMFVAVDKLPTTVYEFKKERWKNFTLQYIKVRLKNLQIKIKKLSKCRRMKL